MRPFSPTPRESTRGGDGSSTLFGSARDGEEYVGRIPGRTQTLPPLRHGATRTVAAPGAASRVERLLAFIRRTVAAVFSIGGGRLGLPSPLLAEGCRPQGMRRQPGMVRGRN